METQPSRAADIDVQTAGPGPGPSFPWVSEFFESVEYDEGWSSITLFAHLEVGGQNYVATTTIERPLEATALWEFFRKEPPAEQAQPMLHGKLGFKGSSGSMVVFDLGTTTDDLEVIVKNEDAAADPDFGHIWIWRYTNEPLGWPTPSTSDACHDEGLSTPVDEYTISTELNRNSHSEVEADSRIWIYAMVEYQETVGALTVNKYWKYKSPAGMPATIGAKVMFSTRRKANPTGVGPTSL